MHRRQYLRTVSVGSLTGVAGCFHEEYDGTDADGPPRLSVDGRWMVDPNGSPVVLRGVSVVDPVWGVERADERGNDYWETLRLATDESAGWHATVLRIPVEPRSIRSVGLEEMVEDYLDRAVEIGAEEDVYVLIDYHAIECYDTPSLDRRLRAFWDEVAPRYAEEPHVLYELFSEPTEPATGGSEAWRTWREHASPWIERVRDHAPGTPLVVGSPAWSSMTRYAAEEPFEFDGLVYSAHIYPSWDRRAWPSEFGTSSFEIPLFVTEWGYAAGTAEARAHADGTTESWGEPFRAWLDAHENVHWCAATFDSRREPAMFDTEWELLGGNDHMGALVKEWLAERRDDHQPGDSGFLPEPEDPPPSPEGVELGAIGADRATITWTVSEEPYDDGILQYRVSVGDREPTTLRGVEDAFDVTDLEPDTEYEVTIAAVDRYGRESEPVTSSFETLEAQSAEAVIARTGTVPGLEGEGLEAWGRSASHSVNQYLWGSYPAEIAVSWKALWDEDALYVYADIDAPLDQIEDDVPADGDMEVIVQVHLDLDGSHEERYDEENDIQLNVFANGDVPPGPDSADTTPVTAQASETDAGWHTMLEIPWGPYGIDPIVGYQLGMDVHSELLVDYDTIGKTSWYDTTDEAWRDPRTFAPVELGE